jgi:hypothetical protein
MVKMMVRGEEAICLGWATAPNLSPCGFTFVIIHSRDPTTTACWNEGDSGIPSHLEHPEPVAMFPTWAIWHNGEWPSGLHLLPLSNACFIADATATKRPDPAGPSLTSDTFDNKSERDLIHMVQLQYPL